ncbi:MAG: GNAT family N-acetyltransferase [Clostridia bacterium]|nr:GNAT family N-acetyltransferase [Clostridia bacterium]MBQ4624516.1 GNAT family N-acetyltransferase [Clostridia bacterium]MBR6764335.1 GNAT family N-acetyltransferase [Clostridia bacterium]
MRHQGTRQIETERLILRRIEERDAEAAFRNWMGDHRVTEYLMWSTHASVGESRSIIGEWMKLYEDPSFYLWTIELRELGEPIGSISVVEQDDRTQKVHIGYCIGSKWWGKGIMTEAFRAVIAYLFEEVGANRVEARHDPRNPGSGKVMQKCGLTYEGTLREADWNNQGIVDECIYGILAKDYFAAKEKK